MEYNVPYLNSFNSFHNHGLFDTILLLNYHIRIFTYMSSVTTLNTDEIFFNIFKKSDFMKPNLISTFEIK